MDAQMLIPALDPNPLPAPYWLFKGLLVLTFLLHILAMNFMFGGGILAAVAKFKSRKDEKYRIIFENLSHKIPSLLAATITIGVAPLLFLQVLYGQFFYSSSVIMGWPWFFVLILLTLVYYGFYIVSLKKQSAMDSKTSWILVISLFMVFTVGFFYSNNLTLSMTPATWAAKYHGDPSGWNMNWGEGTLIPRFLHFFFAAIAIGGLFTAAVGLFLWKKDAENARNFIRFGGKWFMYVTMVQIAVGIWFLISQPQDQMMLFMGGNWLATIGVVAGFAGGMGAILIMSDALRKEDPRIGFYLAAGVIALTVVFMGIMRELLRDSYLADFFNTGNFTVSTQWDVMLLFFIFFLGGVGLWLLMIKRYFFSPELRVNATQD